jgi:hypothetical protein
MHARYGAVTNCAIGAAEPPSALIPPWEGWKLLCCAECALTTHVQHRQALDNLQPGAIGMVSSIPVRVSQKEISQKEKQEWLDV